MSTNKNRQSPKRPASPAKKTVKTAVTTTAVTTTQRFTETMLDQRGKDDLQLALKEKEIELEHKLNTLIALNEKLQVYNDLQKDVAENQQFVRESEAAREELQVQIVQISQKVKEDTELKEQLHNSLIKEI